MSVGTLDIRRLGREVLVGIVSMIVLLYVYNYVAYRQPTPAFAVDVIETQTVATDSVVFYGRVFEAGTDKPVRGTSVTAVRVEADGVVRRVGMVTADPADGTFRMEVQPASAGTYRLVFEANISGATLRDAFTLEASPGHAYGMQAELINREYYVLLPLPGY